MSPRAVGGWSSSLWGCCWKQQATAAVRMAVSRSVGSGSMRQGAVYGPVILGPGLFVMQWGHPQEGW